MFVVFEGVDGSGKTTISNRVARELVGRGRTVKHLRVDGTFASSVTQAIRELGRDAKNLGLVPQAEFLLYVARDVQLLEEVLRPALSEHEIVIADRYLYTAEVLGRFGRHLGPDWTKPILDAAAGGLTPDLVVLVDVQPTLARARRRVAKLVQADKKPPSRKGLAGVGLQHRLRRGYLELARAEPERWVVVDNEGTLEETILGVIELIEQARTRGVPAAIEAFQHAAQARSGALKSRAPLRGAPDALARFLDWLEVRMDREPAVAAYMLSGLFGPVVDERRRRLAEVAPEAILAGLSGLVDETSWELRRRLKEKYPGAVVRSLGSLPNSDPRALALRQELAGRAGAEVASSLSRLDDDSSWTLRERLWGGFPHEVAGSLAALDSERAWALRQRWLAGFGAGVGVDYDASRVACKSVAGSEDERAWAVRERARPAAPVAALSSLTGLFGARSWEWREQNLSHAPKVVMQSIRRVSDPRAWPLRRTVALDCKEAIDSIPELDDPEAWELRDAVRDIWPSTVVKSLGKLAETPRGRALVERQLEVHSDNLSLLKHASAIALGLHTLETNEP
jgi:dTMP kinase